jgi:stearoyl-CoA desaturase (delta-9 desaturase)
VRTNFNIAVFWAAHPLFIVFADFNLVWVLTGVIWSWITFVVGLQIGAHRYFTHTSFSTGPVRSAALNFLTLLPCMGTPQDWIVAHVYHHRHADTQLDPTNVRAIGLWKNYSSLWQKNVPLTAETTRLVVRSLKSNTAKFFFKNYVLVVASWASLLLLLSPQAFVWLFLLPVLVGHWGMNLLNHIGHSEDGPTTSRLFNLVTPGDGFHKFHHENPRAYRFGRGDLLAKIIDVFFK